MILPLLAGVVVTAAALVALRYLWDLHNAVYYDPPDPEVARTKVRDIQERGADALTVNGTGATATTQTLSGTWNEKTDTATSSGSSTPGFPGEDMDDDEVEEWLREWGLSGYD